MTRSMTDVRIRNLDSEVATALEGLAEGEGRTVEAYLRELIKNGVRMRIRDFPTASEWDRAGFGEVRELVPGRQYTAWAGQSEFRITLTRVLMGEQPEWNTEIEEARELEVGGQQLSVWVRATDVATRLLGDSPPMALRDGMRWVADYAGVDAVSRARKGVREVSPGFGTMIDALDAYIAGEKTYPRDKMVIYSTSQFDIYLNEVDDKRGALMVYRSGREWSITDGQADYFTLTKAGVIAIVERLCELCVLPLSTLERL
jgi:hypothetical protein